MAAGRGHSRYDTRATSTPFTKHPPKLSTPHYSQLVRDTHISPDGLPLPHSSKGRASTSFYGYEGGHGRVASTPLAQPPLTGNVPIPLYPPLGYERMIPEPTHIPHSPILPPVATQSYHTVHVCPYPTLPEPFRERPQLPTKPRYVETFDGEKMEWPDYRELFETMADYNRWGVKERAIQMRMNLRGNALSVLSDLGTQEKGDYGLLCQALERRFSPQEKRHTYKMEFRHRNKQATESASEYGFALRRLANKAFPDLTRENLEMWLTDQFIQGLSDEELHDHVFLKHPQDLNEAIRWATEWESLHAIRRRVAKKPQVAIATGQSGGSQDIKDLTQAVSDMQKQLNQLMLDRAGGKTTPGTDLGGGRNRGRNTDSRGPRCYTCGIMGHISRNCPKKSQVQAALVQADLNE